MAVGIRTLYGFFFQFPYERRHGLHLHRWRSVSSEQKLVIPAELDELSYSCEETILVGEIEDDITYVRTLRRDRPLSHLSLEEALKAIERDEDPKVAKRENSGRTPAVLCAWGREYEGWRARADPTSREAADHPR